MAVRLSRTPADTATGRAERWLQRCRTATVRSGEFLLGGLSELCYPAACVLCHGPPADDLWDAEAAELMPDGVAEPPPADSGGSRSLCAGCRATLLATAPPAACRRCGRPQPIATSAAEATEEARRLGIAAEDLESFRAPPKRKPRVGAFGEPLCRWCQKRPGHVERAVALGMYRDVMREAVVAAKRMSCQPLTLALGDMLGNRVRQVWAAVPIGAVTYVPSHWTRRWSRRGCPAQLLAQQVGRIIGVPVLPLVRAIRRTAKQGTLNDTNRRTNVCGAFRAKKGYALSAPRVLVVDDVWTTGATLQEAAGVIRQGYDAEIYAAVLARAIGTHDG